jgi:hypothetical protein
MTAHDERDVETVAEALHADACPGDPDEGEACGCGSYEREAAIVLDALDLPGRERRAKAEMLREAATMLSRLADHGADGEATPYETADWLRARAAELDPEEKP